MKRSIILPALALATVAAVLAGLAAPTPTRAADDGQAFLSKMAGTWRSRGTAREGPNEAAIAILCSVRAKLAANRSAITNSGECASADGKVSVSGRLKYNSSSRTFSGNFFNAKESNFRTVGKGRLKGDAIVLRATVRNDEGRLTGQGSITIRSTGPKKMSMRLVIKELPSGKTFTAMKLTMTRR